MCYVPVPCWVPMAEGAVWARRQHVSSVAVWRRRFQQAELVHSRTAMVGVAGILIPDVRIVLCLYDRQTPGLWSAAQLARQVDHCTPCMGLPAACSDSPPLLAQIATQAGVLNVPQWYESGKIYAEAHPEVPQREHLADHFLLCPMLRLCSPWTVFRRM